jgi:hypothetical protein
VDLPVEVAEPGPGLLHVRIGQPCHRIDLHHQVPPQAGLPGKAADGIGVVFDRPAAASYPDESRERAGPARWHLTVEVRQVSVIGEVAADEQMSIAGQLAGQRRQYGDMQAKEERVTAASRRLMAEIDAFRAGKEATKAAYTAAGEAAGAVWAEVSR